MLTKEEFTRKLPNRLLHGDHKLSLDQWNRIKGAAELLMDKETPMSPYGGITKEEIDEFAGYLSKEGPVRLSKEQVAKVQATMHEFAK